MNKDLYYEMAEDMRFATVEVADLTEGVDFLTVECDPLLKETLGD